MGASATVRCQPYSYFFKQNRGEKTTIFLTLLPTEFPPFFSGMRNVFHFLFKVRTAYFVPYIKEKHIPQAGKKALSFVQKTL